MTEIEQLKAFRKRHGLTQQTASQLLGIKYHTWRGYESGRTIPHIVFFAMAMYEENKQLKGN